MGESPLGIRRKILSPRPGTQRKRTPFTSKPRAFLSGVYFSVVEVVQRGKEPRFLQAKPNEEFDTIYFRFYIYSDNEDSKKVIAFPCGI